MTHEKSLAKTRVELTSTSKLLWINLGVCVCGKERVRQTVLEGYCVSTVGGLHQSQPDQNLCLCCWGGMKGHTIGTPACSEKRWAKQAAAPHPLPDSALPPKEEELCCDEEEPLEGTKARQLALLVSTACPAAKQEGL
jgi:hypothetical protein